MSSVNFDLTLGTEQTKHQRPAAALRQTDRQTLLLHLDSLPLLLHSDRQPLLLHSDRQPLLLHSDRQPLLLHSDRQTATGLLHFLLRKNQSFEEGGIF